MRRKKLITLLLKFADYLDQEGKFSDANIIDENFEEFIEMLENRELDLNEMFFSGQRDPRGPYSMRGRGPVLVC